jgi:hypothetical protein
MDFFALSLPEAAYLYEGLAVQALFRSSSLRVIPAVIVIMAIFVLLGRSNLHGDRRPIGRVVGYGFASTLLLILFWPEAVGRLGGIHGQTSPNLVASYAATQDAGATIITAQATGLVPEPLQSPVLLPTGVRLLLQAFTQTHLELAKAINSQTHRTFAPVLPMQWLLTRKLSGGAKATVRDFTQGCFLPAKAQLMQRATTMGFGPTFQDLLPWGGSQLQGELALIRVTPGGQTGLGTMIRRFLGGSASTSVSCDVYIQQAEGQVQQWLASQTTQRGTPLSQVFQQELGMTPQDQARFLIYREMLRAAGPEVPVPSLMGSYLLLRGARQLGSLVGGAQSGAVAGGRVAGGSGATIGAAVGAAIGAAQGLGNELQRILDGLSSLVGLAVWLTWWGPYILGIINLVVLGLFPIVVIWSLFPQSQFQPLATYFAVLFFTTAAPLWWALVDVAAKLAAGVPPNVWIAPGQFLESHLASLVITALGILAIPITTGFLIFGSWRAIGGLWRGFA